MNDTEWGLNILRMIPPDMKVFDNLSVSSGQESELSGPFSDFEKGDAFVEKRSSQEWKNTDIYAYFSFSEEFKSAMKSAKSEDDREERQKPEETTDVDDAPETKDSHIQLDLEKRAGAFLREIVMDYHRRAKSRGSSGSGDDDGKSSLDSSKRKRKPGKDDKRKMFEDDDEDFFDTMSGYWRMLAAYDDFKISPPDFDAYDNDEPHWLETKPIPFDVMENSRNKCLDWLKHNFDNY